MPLAELTWRGVFPSWFGMSTKMSDYEEQNKKKRKRKKEKEKKERIFNQPKFQDHSVRSFQFYPTLVMLNRSNNSIAPKRHQVKVVLSIGEK